MRNIGRLSQNLFTYLGAGALLVLLAGPLYWIVISSLKPSKEVISRVPTFFPHAPTLEHYIRLLQSRDFVSYLVNSTLVAVGTMGITLVLATLAGYSTYRLKFKGQRLVAHLILVTYAFPGTLLLVPVYRMMSSLGLVDNLWSLVIVNVTFAAPFAVWLLRGFFEAVPWELEEAASIDGAGPLRALTQIILPLVAPGMATIAIYAFLVSWTEFMFASTLIMSDANKTLPMGLQAILAQYNVNWGALSAAATVTTLPALALFTLIGRHFVKGLTAGAIK